MAQAVIVYWRDIPAQIQVRAGRKRTSRELSERFIKTIDRCAMQTGAHGTDAYLEAWRKGPSVPCDATEPQAEADRLCLELERCYDDARLAGLLANGGLEPKP